MKAAVATVLGPVERNPLSITEIETPRPGRGQVLIEVVSCGVCRSNLHMIEGDWAPGTPSRLPIVPGHEVVGVVAEVGHDVTDFSVGDRVGVQPIFSTCRVCDYCVSGREQLCPFKQVTGETVDGGYAEFMLADAAFTYRIPDGLDLIAAAPLLCPGLTAYGSVLKAQLSPGKKVAVFGVGGVGHLVLQLAGLTGADVYAVSRGSDHLALADEIGAIPVSASQSDPVAWLTRRGGMDSSIVFAPSTAVLAQAVQATKPGGVIVVGADGEIGAVPFAQEKTVVGSVLGTRQQMREVLELAAQGKVRAHCEQFPLEEANEALLRLKQGRVRGRAVLVPGR